MARSFGPYHRECKGKGLDRDGCEVFTKDNPIVFFVLEPRDIDHFLDNGMSIWMIWTPANVEIL